MLVDDLEKIVTASALKSDEEPSTVVLVGAPNAGKSSLFNGLTGGRAKVGNYPGVTLEPSVLKQKTIGTTHF